MSNPIWKRMGLSLLGSKSVSRLLRSLLSPFRGIIPDGLLTRVPVVGIVEAKLPGGRGVLRLRDDDGQDTFPRHIYWRGLDSVLGDAMFPLFIGLLKETSVFLDIGANVGVYALIGSVDDPERVVAGFEPAPAAYQRFRLNKRVNDARNLDAVWAALADYDGRIGLHVPRGGISGTASTLAGFRPDCQTVCVPAMTVDSYVRSRALEHVDLMKIDTEGTEDRVLLGARNTLCLSEPIIICEVLKGRCESGVSQALSGLGYKYFLATDDGLVPKRRIEGDPTYRFYNYVFATERRMGSIEPFVLHDVGEAQARPTRARW